MGIDAANVELGSNPGGVLEDAVLYQAIVATDLGVGKICADFEHLLIGIL